MDMYDLLPPSLTVNGSPWTPRLGPTSPTITTFWARRASFIMLPYSAHAPLGFPRHTFPPSSSSACLLPLVLCLPPLCL